MFVLALLIIVSQADEARAAVAAPATINVTSTSNTQISVSWAASTGANGYRVERASTKAGTYALVASPTTNSFTDTTVTTGKSYVYRVRAVDSGGAVSPYGAAQAQLPALG
jgi:fibronectin type 3 domain-containing protein